MSRIRFGLLMTAVLCGTYSIVSWIFGFLFDAGVAGAAAAAAVLLAELIAFRTQDVERDR